MNSILTELTNLNRYLFRIKTHLTEEILNEGVYDPGILKCVFMAGGSGSGKSYIANHLFGIGDTTISYTGLKSINSDSLFEKELEKNGINKSLLFKLQKDDPELFQQIAEKPGGLRDLAKARLSKLQTIYETGRLGLIVDGTGKNYNKIASQREHAAALGYDCYMIFVNTSLEVALQSNRTRDRVLPDIVVQDAWKHTQENLGKFQSLFGAANFIIVDNTHHTPIEKSIHKSIASFINSPIKNPIGKEWIHQQMILKTHGVIK